MPPAAEDARTRPVRPGRRVAALVLAGLFAGACGDGPAGPPADALDLRSAGPHLQFAPPSSPTPDPLRVQVRRRSDEAPRRDVQVAWAVVEGTGAVLERSVTSTDSAGVATAALTLGPDLGRYVVRAELVDGGSAPVEFEAWAVEAPALTSVPSSPVAPGATVTLEGRNFSPVAAHDVVLFGGVRGRVVSAAPERLEVEVPACLPPRPVAVTVSLGAVASAPRTVQVAEGGPVTVLPVGGAVELDGGAATACVRLAADARYLAVLNAAGTVAGARHRVRLRALAPTGGVAPTPAALGAAVALPRGARDGDPQGAWDGALRRRERGLMAAAAGAAPEAVSAEPVPAVGDARTFHVLTGGEFVDVRAVARHVGRQVVLYEDVETPDGALRPEDHALMAARFDDLIHPVVTGAFGEPSDLDGNARVVVLMTPQVNRLTPRGSNGFVGGFFYGLDLLPDRTGSNRGELFYTLVPDPEGRFGDRRPRDLVAAAMPAILAHEFQHMIHFNERVLRLKAAGGEALWLSEALAQMAEDLVAREARARGDGAEAALFEAGNHGRARRFLEDAPATSLIIASGSGSLAERGAGWLFLRWVEEHYGGPAILGTLTRTTRTSAANVEAVTGASWPDLLGAWAIALFDGDEPGLSDPLLADPLHRYRELRPRQDLLSAGERYPLEVHHLGGADGGLLLDALPAAPAHLIVDTGPGTLTLALGAADGGATSAAAGVYVRIVRLR